MLTLIKDSSPKQAKSIYFLDGLTIAKHFSISTQHHKDDEHQHHGVFASYGNITSHLDMLWNFFGNALYTNVVVQNQKSSTVYNNAALILVDIFYR